MVLFTQHAHVHAVVRAIHASKGVFSLDVWTPHTSAPLRDLTAGGWFLDDVRIVTGSKDHQVCVSRLSTKPPSASGSSSSSSSSRGSSTSSSNGTSGGNSGDSSSANGNSGSGNSGSTPSFDGIVVERMFDSLHRGVVKCVHWQPSHAGQVGWQRSYCCSTTSLP